MPRIFVMGGFIPNAGTYMAYHVGLIAAELSGAALFVISENPDERRADIWDYPREAVPVCREEFLRLAGPDDLLIVNPSFSDELFGLRVPCRKLCYAQGFTTFTFLDGFFDCYVSASHHVQQFLKFQYGLSTPCINPFLAPIDVSFVPWEERDNRILIYHKFKDTQYEAFLNRLKQHCDTEFVSIIGNAQQPRQELLATIARHKYVLSLCLCEGFGLVPLEAMALGCVVLGFNGFGGRDYMRYGENCLTVSYPRLEGVLTELRRIVEHETEPAHAHRLRALSEAAMATAGRYGYARFRSDWENVLREFFA